MLHHVCEFEPSMFQGEERKISVYYGSCRHLQSKQTKSTIFQPLKASPPCPQINLGRHFTVLHFEGKRKN